MRLNVTTEAHLSVTDDGVFVMGSESYGFFRRYLDVFDEVRVLARTVERPRPLPGSKRVDGPGVGVHELGESDGFGGRPGWVLRTRKEVDRVIANGGGAWLLRSPGLTAGVAWIALRSARRAFGIEVVADPMESFRRAVSGSTGMAVVRPLAVGTLRRQCREALCAAYVSERSLQKRYPASSPHVFTYSSVDIGEEAFGKARRVAARQRMQPEGLQPIRLGFVGRLDRPFKGLDTLVEACAILRSRGREVRLEVIGGGALSEHYQKASVEFGLGDNVCFHGEMSSGEDVYALLAECDLFVLPSRREGVPRAMIEAMAVGLPCLGTCVGGIPELLEERDLAPPNDAECIAGQVEAYASCRERRLEAGRANYERAQAFHRDVLNKRRRAFYEVLAECGG